MRGRAAQGAVTAALTAVAAFVIGLAAGPATGQDHWPAAVDWVRRWPWQVLGVGLVLSVALALLSFRQQNQRDAAADDPLPPSAPEVPGWFVDRAQSAAAAAAVCGRHTAAVGLSTALTGAGGFGKTTLATAVAANRRVRRHFRGRVYTVTIGREVQGRAAIAAKVAETTRFLTGDTTEFDDPALAGDHLGRLLDARPRTLLVLDDVWSRQQLTPFLRGGSGCVRLVTTRDPGLLPADAARVEVDEMSPAQARALLLHELPPLPSELTGGLLQVTGRWPLLLRLVNRLVAAQDRLGGDPGTYAAQLLTRLRTDGPLAADGPDWDLDDPERRNQAVAASFGAALELLPPGAVDCFTELGVFAEDAAVPVPLVARLWSRTRQLTEDRTRAVCGELARLSLVSLTPADGGHLQLHDVVRDYLRSRLGPEQLRELHGRLADAAAEGLPRARPLDEPEAAADRTAWWETDSGYLLDHLVGHLHAAGRGARAEQVAADLRWVETRLRHAGPAAPWSDLEQSGTRHSQLLARSLAQTAHLLTGVESPDALVGVLHQRLDTQPEWQEQVAARRAQAPGPYLASRWRPPDLPHPALRRTLGITAPDRTLYPLALSPDGRLLAVAYREAPGESGASPEPRGPRGPRLTGRVVPARTRRVLEVWDARLGIRRSTTVLPPGTDPRDELPDPYVPLPLRLLFAPDGSTLTALSEEGVTEAVWEQATGAWSHPADRAEATFAGASADGSWLVLAHGGRLRVEHRATGRGSATLAVNEAVRAAVVSADGSRLATADGTGEVTLRELPGGNVVTTLAGESPVLSLHLSARGDALAVLDEKGWVRHWTARAQHVGRARHLGSRVMALALAPDGSWLATGGADGSIRIQGIGGGRSRGRLYGHTKRVTALVVAAEGEWLASAAADGTVRTWDRAFADAGPALLRSTPRPVRQTVAARNGGWLASLSDDGLVRFWNPFDGSQCDGAEHSEHIRTLAVAPHRDSLTSGGSTLVTADDEGAVVRWDPLTWLPELTLAEQRTDPPTRTACAVAPDGRIALARPGLPPVFRVGRQERTEAATGRRTRLLRALRRLRRGAAESRPAVVFAPNGLVYTLGWGTPTGVRCWDPATAAPAGPPAFRGELVLRDPGPRSRALTLAPDGSWLATADEDGAVRLLDTATGALLARLRVHTGPVTDVVASPDGTLLATTGEDGALTVRTVADHRPLAAARADAALNSLTWVGGSAALVAAGERGLYGFTLHR
ncbi:NB-ARC domain-containing protein [Streptomyces sp. SCSIO ZS0520]|uniref:NB-ARC domain-containing protein n=1 Tax=Streptomyces sp. SCSIO ZS0520 TaxID=2892996 RepID=UPI0021D92B50|nr:NB-ARC domain-containing protein [Streptomyces sp. SCSIO ZS0520]